MLFKAVAYVFIFLSRIRYPQDQPMTVILRKRYNNDVIKSVRRLEKLDFKYRKIQLDLSFLIDCLESKLIPKFLHFRVANNKLHSSEAYTECQLQLLREEIKIKEKKLLSINKELIFLKNSIRNEVWLLDFAHITSMHMRCNEKRIQDIKLIHDKKFANLKYELTLKHNPDAIIHNLSSYTLTAVEKDLLLKGLNFTISPNKLNYSDYCLGFENLFRDIKNIKNLNHDNLQFIKSKLKETALTSFRKYNRKKHQPTNLPTDEYNSLKSLSSLNNLVIQKSDKGNSIVILDKEAYFGKVEELLTDERKFHKLEIPTGKEVQALTKMEDRIKTILDRLEKEKSITKFQKSRLNPMGSRPGVLYGLAKIHKPFELLPDFRPILSAIGTATYNIAKYLVPIMSAITFNEYTIKNSFKFGKEIMEQDSRMYMGSLDVKSLFTSIPLTETIDLCTNLLFEGKETVSKLKKRDFKELLESAAKESCFIFNDQYYAQTDGVAMGSPLGPTLANAFMSFNEKIWLENCPPEIRPSYYRRYVDDIFVLVKSEQQLKLFKEYFNTCHPNIKFTSEREENGYMPFLDFNVYREEGKFVTSVYRKPTFTGLYSNFNSLIPVSYKFGLVLTLLHRVFSICSTYKQFHEELEKLTAILRKNSYPEKFIERCIRKFLNKHFGTVTPRQEEVVETITLVLPFLGNLSLQIKKQLQKLFSENLPVRYKCRIVFKSQTKLSQFFKFKDILPKHLMSHVVYKYTCDRCNAIYYGLTMRHVKVRWNEHLGISPLTGKNIVGVQSDIRDHSKLCASAKWENFEVIARDDNRFHLRVKESLLISRDLPGLNKDKYSTPLFLFK